MSFWSGFLIVLAEKIQKIFFSNCSQDHYTFLFCFQIQYHMQYSLLHTDKSMCVVYYTGKCIDCYTGKCIDCSTGKCVVCYTQKTQNTIVLEPHRSLHNLNTRCCCYSSVHNINTTCCSCSILCIVVTQDGLLWSSRTGLAFISISNLQQHHLVSIKRILIYGARTIDCVPTLKKKKHVYITHKYALLY